MVIRHKHIYVPAAFFVNIDQFGLIWIVQNFKGLLYLVWRSKVDNKKTYMLYSAYLLKSLYSSKKRLWAEKITAPLYSRGCYLFTVS